MNAKKVSAPVEEKHGVREEASVGGREMQKAECRVQNGGLKGAEQRDGKFKMQKWGRGLVIKFTGSQVFRFSGGRVGLKRSGEARLGGGWHLRDFGRRYGRSFG